MLIRTLATDIDNGTHRVIGGLTERGDTGGMTSFGRDHPLGGSNFIALLT